MTTGTSSSPDLAAMRATLDEGKSREELLQEVAALRRQVAELEVPARRFKAIFDCPLIGIQILDSTSHVTELNEGFELIWQLKLEQVRQFVALEDAQIEAAGNMPGVRGVFFACEPVRFPPVRYNPQETGTVRSGATRWVTSWLIPIPGDDGRAQEAVGVYLEIGDMKRSEDELRVHNAALEEAVTARTRDLEENLRLLNEQRMVVMEMSTPVLRIWEGILVLPLVGVLDNSRAAQVMENLLDAIVAQQAHYIIIDITGVPTVDTGVAAHLLKTVKATQLLGATCTLVGISPAIAQALVLLGVDFGRTKTFGTLQDGLRDGLCRLERRPALPGAVTPPNP